MTFHNHIFKSGCCKEAAVILFILYSCLFSEGVYVDAPMLHEKLKTLSSTDSQIFTELVNEIKEEVVKDAKRVFAISETMETSEIEISGLAIGVLWQLQELLIQVILDSFNSEDAEAGLDHLEKAVEANQTIKSSFAIQLDKAFSDKRQVDSMGISEKKGRSALRVCDYAFLAMQGLLKDETLMSKETLMNLDAFERDWLISQGRKKSRWQYLLGVDLTDDASEP